MASVPDELESGGAEETAPGVRLLKKIWNISDQEASTGVVPSEVTTDIYNVPVTARRIPHRKRSH